MTSEPTPIAVLFKKLADNTATAQEIEQYYQLVNKPELELEIKELMSAALNAQDLGQTTEVERIDRVYFELYNEITSKEGKSAKVGLRLWLRIAAVAAVVALTFIGIYFYNNWISYHNSQLAMQKVAPGKVGATLTLANGKKIRLSDVSRGEIAREAGISVTKTAEGQLVYEIKSNENGRNDVNTLSTAKGETYVVTLPDKSKVWLNAASSLTYTAGLVNKGIRKIKLLGEAYFEISKDKEHPFVVESNHQQVEVLGTHFNINAYGDESAILTTLLEGSVKVTSGQYLLILKPGLQAINNGRNVKVAEADLESAIDWMKGDFNLDGLNFKAAMRKIGRWYDLEVIYDQSVSDNIMSGGWISRNTKLSTILEVVERSGQVHFELKGRKLYVSK
ncbi:FecR domain-containing protein [Pedobacter sp. MC2016-14]|uniref:FecR family protein n=1 Tax=Pedobacter sp. MC2016-14 TaxID=2897327 RepID=UPI001E62CB26|nr:FecR family protein [Pedobacter sp. MC2016-14]MCD0488612.1 FecR domain-containing protein [Pedobacter sp. MC2016-14]